MFSLNYLNSNISDLSLGQTKTQSRRNINAIFKYGYKNGWVDNFTISMIYSPYEVNGFITDALDSDYQLEGGAYGSAIQLKQDFKYVTWASNLSLNISDSSRDGPAHF